MIYFKYDKHKRPPTKAAKENIKMSEKRNKQIEMLIRFFNFQAGTSFKVSIEKNRIVVNDAIERAREDVVTLKNHIIEWVKAKGDESKYLCECFEAYEGKLIIKEPLPEKPKVIDITPARVNAQTALDFLGAAVVDILAKTKVDEIQKAVLEGCEDKVREFVKKEYGTIKKKIVTVIDGEKVEVEGVQHSKFDTVVKFVANNEPVFLTGAAGTGKNVLCQQVAKALGLNFYFSNAVTQEYKITGFTDAMGVFHESQFYKAFKNGGLFMLDEMDASIPEVLVILNAAIANRYFDFPAPIGYVEAHPDFRVVAAGNTFGLGANYEYVGRNQLDMASLDRFAVVKIDYDRNIEMSVANGNTELVDFAEDFRKAASEAGVRFIISYRAIGRIAKLEKLLSLEETLETCLIKSLEKDDINVILSNMTVSNKYRSAVEKIKRGM